MKEEGIAPCGMNCRLCVNYQMYEKDLTKKGFHRAPCPGCIPRGKIVPILEIPARSWQRARSDFVSNVNNIPASG
ncbi:DUF3795 domain-containing protein [Alkalibacter rhizosphaerae]|uniref:DUF3795 domain-containing protein n=1 Tax=Alkalibacter rhizosphaerae TaxID=2815577 RepID=A0A974XFF4_9FIRM|nr:DUF3795 domain-containing protein [Alkalibacter rhizosphaerae]QSX07625.1 DUF3795 domain-containing protein [Alkalibacter rhizosphaerae]